MTPIINFIFSIGYRCYSPGFLNNFKLRKMSSPFDYLFIDFETSLKIINNNFEDYLYDIILFNKNNKHIELFYKKNTTKINNKYNETTTLFHITKIINCENIVDYMNNIVELKIKYSIKCFIIIIINCDNIEDSEYYNEVDKCLFIIKKVENYETQYTKYQTDNNLNYEKEFNIISKYFTLNLIDKNDI